MSVRLLAIDDHPESLITSRHDLAQSGFLLQTRPALHLLALPTTPPPCDILLLDLHATVPHYLNALHKLRAHAHTLPLVLLVERDRAHEPATLAALSQAASLGIHGVLFKPCDYADLQRTLRAARQHQRIRRMRQRLGHFGLERPTAPSGAAAQQQNEQIVELVLDELGYEWAMLSRWYPEDEKLHIVACAANSGALYSLLMTNHDIPLLGTPGGWALRNRSALLISSHTDGQPIPAELHDFFAAYPSLSMLTVPVLNDKQPLGVICAATTQRPLDGDDQEVLQLLAEHVATALHQTPPVRTVTVAAAPLTGPGETLAQAIVTHTPGALWLLDGPGQRILDANAAAEQMSGYSRAALRELAPQELFSRLDTTGEALLFTHHQQHIPVVVTSSHFLHEGQDMRLLLACDLRRERATSQQAARNEKHAAIGRLVSGIAHEINNPLQAIYNTLHLLITRAANGNEARHQQYLAMAQAEVEHLIEMVRRVLDIYRPTHDSMRPVDVHEALHAVITAMQPHLSAADVRVIYVPSPGLPHTLGINSHIKQVYETLILNAIQSMPRGGTLTIRTYPDHVDATANGAASGDVVPDGVVIEFTDTGHGIPPDDLAKVFEPFYTTRMNSSGLSLAISYGVVEQHQGKLTVQSEVGHGTTFWLRLPAAQEGHTGP
jgi:two-component system NtrC family sensor kinase